MLPGEGRRFLGRTDPPLAPIGIEQATCLAERLGKIGFDSIYSSDLLRCLMTAEIIARQATPALGADGAQILTEPRLREIDCGLWEGLTREEAAARYPEDYRRRERDLFGTRFTGGESFEDLRARVLPALEEIIEAGGAKVLIVGHLGVNRVVLCEFQGLPSDELFSIKLDYCSVVSLRVSTSLAGSRKVEVLDISSVCS